MSGGLFLNDPSKSDLIFVVDGQQFFAHKEIVRHCKTFETFLKRDPLCNKIEVTNTSCVAFHVLLRQFYEPNLSIWQAVPSDCPSSLILQIWELALRFKVQPIIEWGTAQLSRNMNAEVACGVLAMTVKYNQMIKNLGSLCETLIKLCMDFFANNSISDCDDYRIIVTNQSLYREIQNFQRHPTQVAYGSTEKPMQVAVNGHPFSVASSIAGHSTLLFDSSMSSPSPHTGAAYSNRKEQPPVQHWHPMPNEDPPLISISYGHNQLDHQITIDTPHNGMGTATNLNPFQHDTNHDPDFTHVSGHSNHRDQISHYKSRPLNQNASLTDSSMGQHQNIPHSILLAHPHPSFHSTHTYGRVSSNTIHTDDTNPDGPHCISPTHTLPSPPATYTVPSPPETHTQPSPSATRTLPSTPATHTLPGYKPSLLATPRTERIDPSLNSSRSGSQGPNPSTQKDPDTSPWMLGLKNTSIPSHVAKSAPYMTPVRLSPSEDHFLNGLHRGTSPQGAYSAVESMHECSLGAINKIPMEQASYTCSSINNTNTSYTIPSNINMNANTSYTVPSITRNTINSDNHIDVKIWNSSTNTNTSISNTSASKSMASHKLMNTPTHSMDYTHTPSHLNTTMKADATAKAEANKGSSPTTTSMEDRSRYLAFLDCHKDMQKALQEENSKLASVPDRDALGQQIESFQSTQLAYQQLQHEVAILRQFLESDDPFRGREATHALRLRQKLELDNAMKQQKAEIIDFYAKNPGRKFIAKERENLASLEQELEQTTESYQKDLLAWAIERDHLETRLAQGAKGKDFMHKDGDKEVLLAQEQDKARQRVEGLKLGLQEVSDEIRSNGDFGTHAQQYTAAVGMCQQQLGVLLGELSTDSLETRRAKVLDYIAKAEKDSMHAKGAVDHYQASNRDLSELWASKQQDVTALQNRIRLAKAEQQGRPTRTKGMGPTGRD